jgi:hypothetical protein
LWFYVPCRVISAYTFRHCSAVSCPLATPIFRGWSSGHHTSRVSRWACGGDPRYPASSSRPNQSPEQPCGSAAYGLSQLPPEPFRHIDHGYQLHAYILYVMVCFPQCTLPLEAVPPLLIRLLAPIYSPGAVHAWATDSATTLSRPCAIEHRHEKRPTSSATMCGAWHMARRKLVTRSSPRLVTVMWRELTDTACQAPCHTTLCVAAPSPTHLRLPPPVRPIRLVPSHFPCELRNHLIYPCSSSSALSRPFSGILRDKTVNPVLVPFRSAPLIHFCPCFGRTSDSALDINFRGFSISSNIQ